MQSPCLSLEAISLTLVEIKSLVGLVFIIKFLPALIMFNSLFDSDNISQSHLLSNFTENKY
jgi:hypothetical protein